MRLTDVVAELTPFYGPDCPAAIVARASWPDERIVRATLGEIVGALRETPIERTALILVGPALGAEDFRESELYNADYVRRFRAGEASEAANERVTSKLLTAIHALIPSVARRETGVSTDALVTPLRSREGGASFEPLRSAQDEVGCAHC